MTRLPEAEWLQAEPAPRRIDWFNVAVWFVVLPVLGIALWAILYLIIKGVA
tara:strand:- start:206 stop:358 length:153 start_codon:yes stop_codon:yes gene_type:complete